MKISRAISVILQLLGSSATAAATNVPNVMINPGVQMPSIAFGTAKTSFTGCTVEEAVVQWLHLGGRHIDTADMYGTQPDVGRAIKAAGVPRSDIFITTKISGPIGKQAAISKILNTALPELGVEYIDLVLIHFPCGGANMTGCGSAYAAERKDTFEGLADLAAKSKIRAVGVSNFDVGQVQEIVAAFEVAPAVNQVQFHLAYHNETLLQGMKKVGTVLEAWASLGGPTVHGREPTISLGDARLKALAAKYKKSTAQVVLRWETQKGVVPVTATCTASHAAGDLDSFGFKLDHDDVAALDAMMPSVPIVV